MAKYKRKVQLALEARRREFDSIPAQQRQGMARPGSQNRKKGWNVNGRRR